MKVPLDAIAAIWDQLSPAEQAGVNRALALAAEQAKAAEPPPKAHDLEFTRIDGRKVWGQTGRSFEGDFAPGLRLD